MDFKILQNYKHAKAAISLTAAVDQMFVMQMMAHAGMARNLYVLLSNCKEYDTTDPVIIENEIFKNFNRIDGTFALIVKFLSAFIGLDNKLKEDVNKDMAINQTAMYLQATLAEVTGGRHKKGIRLDDTFKYHIFESIDNFIYSIEQ